jgi:predicted DNA-binding transcriptional regulator AlpA
MTIIQHIFSDEQLIKLISKIDSLTVPEKQEEVMTPKDLMSFLKVSRTTIINYQNNSGLPFHKISGGSGVYYLKSEVIQWLKTK